MSTNKATKSSAAQSNDAMKQFKNRVASELGVNLQSGDNGDLTSREAGSIGGEMVRRMIKDRKQNMK